MPMLMLAPNARPEWRGAKGAEMQIGRAIPRPLQAARYAFSFDVTRLLYVFWVHALATLLTLSAQGVQIENQISQDAVAMEARKHA